MKKTFSVLFGILVIVCISAVVLANRSSSPFDPVYDFRKDIVKNHEPLKIQEMDKIAMIYSVGKANNSADNMYFVDMVEKSLVGYKWLGGGGHINRDIGRDKEFVFSAQLLNEEQNINPTIIGVSIDEEIKNISVQTQGESNKASIYEREQEGENFYYIPLSDNVANNMVFVFEITYKDNVKVEYLVSEISEFQDGKQIYFYNE
ncbi:hypothetical protein [Clostridium sp.]|uniref:hypothetical protein n=1 Tax=Clostridium sp. TaxID=1506 RepID=UPI003F4C167A